MVQATSPSGGRQQHDGKVALVCSSFPALPQELLERAILQDAVKEQALNMSAEETKEEVGAPRMQRVLGVGACNWQIFWAESARARRAGGSAW